MQLWAATWLQYRHRYSNAALFAFNGSKPNSEAVQTHPWLVAGLKKAIQKPRVLVSSVLQAASNALVESGTSWLSKANQTTRSDAAHLCVSRGLRDGVTGAQAAAQHLSLVAKCSHVRAASGHLQGSPAARALRAVLS